VDNATAAFRVTACSLANGSAARTTKKIKQMIEAIAGGRMRGNEQWPPDRDPAFTDDDCVTNEELVKRRSRSATDQQSEQITD
jgi:hypothetical protein